MKPLKTISALPGEIIRDVLVRGDATPEPEAALGTSDGNGMTTASTTEAHPDSATALPQTPPLGTKSVTTGLGDISRFRLSQNFGAAAPVKKLLTTVPIRKPHNQEFVRASENLVFEAFTYTWKDDGRLFLVEPEFVDAFPEPLRPTLLVGTTNRQGVFFFWPIFLQQGDEAWNDWHRSAHDAMLAARTHWIRVASSRALGAYEAHQAVAPGLPPPTWPDLDLDALLQIAFRDYVINGPEHVVVRRLKGEL